MITEINANPIDWAKDVYIASKIKTSTDDDGNEIKIRGKKNVKPYFEEHKEIFKRLYNKTYEMLSNKEDTNFTTFEKMFGVENIEEHLGINLDTLDQ